MNFQQCSLGPRARLHLCETDKYKSLTCKIFIQQDLKREFAGSTALIPRVLQRGSAQFPSTQRIAEELEYLYAAEFGADVLKIGERQILEFYFEMIDPALLPREDQLLERGLEAFWDITARPAGAGNRFLEDYFQQEKENLKKELEGLRNEKGAYALARFTALMCAQEPFGVYKLGEPGEAEKLDNCEVFKHYRDLLSVYPLDIFLVGPDLDPIARFFGDLLRGRGEAIELNGPKPVAVEKPRFFAETMEMQQAMLVLGYRTNCTYLDDNYYSLLVGNGILGGFPHSKLFLNVREKAGLAYSVGSNIEGSKGLLTIIGGIDSENWSRAAEIIEAQLEEVRQGKISPEELEQTKRGLITAMAGMEDHPGALIDRNLMGIVHEQMRSIRQVAEAIEKVGLEDVQEVMSGLVLDTTYVLGPSEKGVQRNGAN